MSRPLDIELFALLGFVRFDPVAPDHPIGFVHQPPALGDAGAQLILVLLALA